MPKQDLENRLQSYWIELSKGGGEERKAPWCGQDGGRAGVGRQINTTKDGVSWDGVLCARYL
jgi:hypothetical protein